MGKQAIQGADFVAVPVVLQRHIVKALSCNDLVHVRQQRLRLGEATPETFQTYSCQLSPSCVSASFGIKPVFLKYMSAEMSKDDLFSVIVGLVRQRKFADAAEIIRKEIKNNPRAFSGGGKAVTTAHVLALAADWGAISNLLPKGTNFFHSSGWLNSLYSGRPINAEGEPVPWLTYPAIDFLDGRVKSDWKIFEWGSGNSTIWWSNRVCHVSAVEDDEGWYNACKNSYKENVSISFEKSADGYVNAVNSGAHGLYDVVVIDGSFRNECAKAAVNRVAPDGIIVFDNSDVPAHEEGVRFITECGWRRLDFFGLIPSYLYKNCTSIFFRTDKILENSVLPTQVKFSTGLTCSRAMKS